jgi:arabinoxylan arabinofuranohydrolase
MPRPFFFIAALTCAFLFSARSHAQPSGYAANSANPILPGYYADPSILSYQGKHYIYATLDPWGDETLGCWESTDFKNWTFRALNWPTKKLCKSPTSGSSSVWAPSVVQARDGKFYMYVSVGNEVWVGKAESPLGPWKNLLGDQPLINRNFRPGYHMIDAEAFIDDDGSAYLYWGSGLNWKNGKCWVVKLKPDMMSFDGEVHDVTPANYFEGPVMIKQGGRYYLTYSQGITKQETYRVHYAVGDTPFGPFTEASNSPMLVTHKALNVIAPGHHALFRNNGKVYILYHRHSIPFDQKFIGRQTCVDELTFTPDGLIAKIVPTHEGPSLVQGRLSAQAPLAAIATASSQRNEFSGADRVSDNNYATRWAAANDAAGAWLQLDLGSKKTIARQELRLEYAWKKYRFKVEASDDGTRWYPMADYTRDPVIGSPITIEKKVSARYLRLVFPEDVKGSAIALFEWNAFAR